MFVDLPRRTLSIHFANPLARQSFAGVCIENKYDVEYPHPNEVNNSWHRIWAVVSNNQATPAHCILDNNWRTAHDLFEVRSSLSNSGYNIGLYINYIRNDLTKPTECFNQELTIVIRNAWSASRHPSYSGYFISLALKYSGLLFRAS